MLNVLLITGSSNHNMWYAHLIGCVVPLLAIEEIEYKSLQSEGFVNFVLKSDAEIVEIDPTKINMYANYVQEYT